MTQVFYPNEKFVRTDTVSETGMTAVSELMNGYCRSTVYRDGAPVSAHELAHTPGLPEKHLVKECMFHCLRAIDGYMPDWGMLTGIRPSKLVHALWEQGLTDDGVLRRLTEGFYVSEQKARLCIAVAHAERRVFQQTPPAGYSVYIGIPYCPSRCLYCSFTSYSIKSSADGGGGYLRALIKEMAACAAFGNGRAPDAVYIGGGTPTVLDAQRLEELLTAVTRYYPNAREYTLEAGRPDTLDADKLRLIKHYGITRLSINPQTMNDGTLRRIGREHTRAQFLAAFETARAAGHGNINVDLIVGLPGEHAADVDSSLEQVLALTPESLTVHMLAVKRASRLKTEGHSLAGPPREQTARMVESAKAAAERAGLYAYYMYRQKNMLGNLENVGYARPGCECVYNVQIMAERQSILALGSGAVTKTYDPNTGRIERLFNVKNVDEYIKRIDEMIERKRVIL